MNDKTLGAYERHESPDYADGGVAAALIEKEAQGTVGALIAELERHRARAEKAERERDSWESIAQQTARSIEALRAEQPRPLTPDAITDEARDRAYRAVAALSVCDWDDMSGVAKGRAMALVEAVITEITRPEPTARPEGAEDIDEHLRQANAAALGGALTLEQRRALADHLAGFGYRNPIALPTARRP